MAKETQMKDLKDVIHDFGLEFLNLCDNIEYTDHTFAMAELLRIAKMLCNKTEALMQYDPYLK